MMQPPCKTWDLGSWPFARTMRTSSVFVPVTFSSRPNITYLA